MQWPDISTDAFSSLQTLVPVFYIAIALYLTTHILRFKSDPRGSLLWITLIWFAPLIGALLYLTFGINRIRRRAQKLGVEQLPQSIPKDNNQRAEEDAYWQGFRRLGDQISGNQLVPGNKIEIIEGVDLIHNHLIDAINASDRQILMSAFIFNYDDLGKRVVASLASAKERGVQVLVSLDGFANGFYHGAAYRAMRRKGISVHRFLHSYWPWRMPYLNLRNHRKLLIVDEAIGFTGSANIGRVGNGETHFKIQGAAVAQLISAFKDDWALSTRTPFPNSNSVTTPARGKTAIRGIRSGPAYTRSRSRTILSGALGVANDSITIVTPYFIPDKAMLSDLELACLRGVNVELILPKRSNHRFADWASRRQLKILLDAGCKVYLQSGHFDHSKLMVVDNIWSLIGSSNWDARSLRLNFEFDLECYDAGFASELNQVIQVKKETSEFLFPSHYAERNLYEQLRDSAARLMLPYL